jgi:4-hydroxy-3-polyprenylbenzoate decarboxylase
MSSACRPEGARWFPAAAFRPAGGHVEGGAPTMKLVIAITGASGAIYGIRILEELKKQSIETHLVISRWGLETIRLETAYTDERVRGLASCCYAEDELTAAIASGSFPTEGMIIAPCSMKTLAAIAHGYCDNLISRAADVTIKERRKLLLVTRETPLSPIHLVNMLVLARLGVTIFPPVPAFYVNAATVEEIVVQSVGRILDSFGIQVCGYRRWETE